MVLVRTCGLAVAFGCAGRALPPPVGNSAPTRELTVTADGVGPVTAKSQALLVPLREALRGYDVTPHNVSDLQYDVARNGEELFYVIPNGDDGLVYNVHITSAHVAIAGKRWRVGQPLADNHALDRCECWGNQPICYKTGEHVAAVVDHECEPTPDAVKGAAIVRIVWNPQPFGDYDDSGDEGSDFGDD